MVVPFRTTDEAVDELVTLHFSEMETEIEKLGTILMNEELNSRGQVRCWRLFSTTLPLVLVLCVLKTCPSRSCFVIDRTRRDANASTCFTGGANNLKHQTRYRPPKPIPRHTPGCRPPEPLPRRTIGYCPSQTAPL